MPAKAIAIPLGLFLASIILSSASLSPATSACTFALSSEEKARNNLTFCLSLSRKNSLLSGRIKPGPSAVGAMLGVAEFVDSPKIALLYAETDEGKTKNKTTNINVAKATSLLTTLLWSYNSTLVKSNLDDRKYRIENGIIIYMTATGHAIIGTVIAAKIGNPTMAIPLAIASHVAADYFPHWDFATNRKFKTKERVFKESVADVLFGFLISYLIIYFLFPQANLIYTFLIIIAAQSLDWLMAPYFFWKIKIFKWAYEIGKATNRELNKPWGIINQVAILFILVLLAKVF